MQMKFVLHHAANGLFHFFIAITIAIVSLVCLLLCIAELDGQ